MLDSSIDQCIHVFRISLLSLFIFAVVDLTELEVNDKMSPGALLNKLYAILCQTCSGCSGVIGITYLHFRRRESELS